MHTFTYTLVELEVSPACHAEIERLLLAAGYDHAVDDSETPSKIDMTSILLTTKLPKKPATIRTR